MHSCAARYIRMQFFLFLQNSLSSCFYFFMQHNKPYELKNEISIQTEKCSDYVEFFFSYTESDT